MKKSAGVVLIWNRKILLCHPTRSSWTATYSIPKGSIEIEESIRNAAIRETMEEVGIDVSNIIGKEYDGVIEYTNKKGKISKKVFYFVIRIKSLSEIRLENEIIDENKLQLDEIDWAGFVDIETAKLKIFKRFISFIDLL